MTRNILPHELPALNVVVRRFRVLIAVAGAMGLLARAQAQDAVAELDIKADAPAAQVSPILYGLMTEEINHSYDGGLYAELVINRSFDFKESPEDRTPSHWRLVGDTNSAAMSIDHADPLNVVRTNSLKLEVTKLASGGQAGVANEGFWGIPVRPNTPYRASFYARSKGWFSSGPLTVSIIDAASGTVYASAKVPKVTKHWKKYEVTLETGNVPESKDNLLTITTAKPATIWFSLVSLFPPTYNHRPNGNRPDIMQLLADMKPAFLRFPGGNYVEGNAISNHFDWKKTLGDIASRPGHNDDGWRYWSSDGMGLLEFLEWCEDLHMQPVLAVYAGYSMRQGAVPTNELDRYVQDALDEIEYVTGGAGTKWGAQRVKDGHAAPFPLTYVEVGNEDNGGTAGRTYNNRFTSFYDAIKARYPALQVISTAPSTTRIVTNRVPDLKDDHFYPSRRTMFTTTHLYDNRSRTGPRIFVGEWATREGVAAVTPNFGFALSDAAWLTGLERNSDLVVMASYAPLFVNVNPGAFQWRPDLIGYDALHSYGSPSYYVQKMFSLNHGDSVLHVDDNNIPEMEPPAAPQGRRGAAASTNNATRPRMMPALFYVATRDSKQGTIYLKVVNADGVAHPVLVNVSGVKSIDSDGESIVLSADSPTDTNSIDQPTKIVPVTTKVDGLGASFTRTFAPYSVTILVMNGH